MFYSTLLLAAATTFSGLAHAQNSTGTDSCPTTYSTSGPLEIDPNSVDLAERQSWCLGQKNNCYKICGGADANLGDASTNDCDANDLTYTCECRNGNQPNISDYTSTLPFYVCQEWIRQCTCAYPDDAEGQFGCQSVTCGTMNASAAVAGSSTSGSAAMPSSTSGGGSGGSSSSDSDPSSSSSAAQSSQTGNSAVAVGASYGTGILVSGLMLVFGLGL